MDWEWGESSMQKKQISFLFFSHTCEKENEMLCYYVYKALNHEIHGPWIRHQDPRVEPIWLYSQGFRP